MRKFFSLVIVAPLLLTGCALISSAPSSAIGGLALTGAVHGGQSPIIGARVYLMGANTTGYGNASLSLLNPLITLQSDSIGGYVTTDVNGTFSITGDYVCTANQQVYIYAVGGNPGAGVNSASGLMAALGTCPVGGSFALSLPLVQVNEVTTVAAAYAIAGYATDPTHVSSSGTALAQAGIAHAFANAANLASIVSGQALAATPSGIGTVPQATINTLANILAACINSTGPSSIPCSTLFANAKANGASGAVPADTATVAINIAHNPGANIATIYKIPTPSAPFAPTLSTQPNNFTVGIQFAIGGASFSSGGLAIDSSGNAWVSTTGGVAKLSPTGAVTSFLAANSLQQGKTIAIDPSDNAWFVTSNSVVKLSNTGAIQSPTGGYTGGGLSSPHGIAIDGLGQVWVANASGSSVSEFSGSGVPLSPVAGYTGGGYAGGNGIAIDATENVWATTGSGSSYKLSEFSNAGIPISLPSGYSGGGLAAPDGLAIDASGNIWVANTFSNVVSKFSNTGTPVSASGYAIANFPEILFLAIDGGGNIWLPDTNTNSLYELSQSGTLASPTSGYAVPVTSPQSAASLWDVAIDGSGDVWLTTNSTVNSVTELIGVATPVVTPLSAGVKTNTLGSRP